MALPGVVGVGRAVTGDGLDVVDVMVADELAVPLIPAESAGFPVRIRLVPGRFRAYGR